MTTVGDILDYIESRVGDTCTDEWGVEVRDLVHDYLDTAISADDDILDLIGEVELSDFVGYVVDNLLVWDSDVLRLADALDVWGDDPPTHVITLMEAVREITMIRLFESMEADLRTWFDAAAEYIAEFFKSQN